MVSPVVGSPSSNWGPYVNPRDCSSRLCSIYCPQWCSGFYQNPPPLDDEGSSSSSGLSPLVISIIVGILASSFLLLCYFIYTRYFRGHDSSLHSPSSFQPWRRWDRSTTRPEDLLAGERPQATPPSSVSEGLDETLINRISACRYRSSEGLVGSTDCSVCLTEFQEGESLRLLPECSHAFHVACIDTWLKNHSNCPVCRSGIVWAGPIVDETVAVVEIHDTRR